MLASRIEHGDLFLWEEKFKISWEKYGKYIRDLRELEQFKSVSRDEIADFFENDPHGPTVQIMVRQVIQINIFDKNFNFWQNKIDF